MTPNTQKALLPILPLTTDEFSVTATAAELTSGGDTFGKLYGGKVVTIWPSTGTCYIAAEYGSSSAPSDADTEDFDFDGKVDFYVKPSARVSAVGSEALTLYVTVTSE